MEKLTSLTPEDVNRGALQQMLNDAGIQDVPEYANEFHKQTENLIVEDLQNSNETSTNEERPIVTPLDIQRWWKTMGPHPEQNIKSVGSSETSKPIPPGDLSSLIKTIVPTIEEKLGSTENVQQLSAKFFEKAPASLDNWIKRIVEKHLDEETTSTSRLSSYLNAAQAIFNQFGYGISSSKLTAAAAPTSASKEEKPSRFADVKQMYFLWKCIDMNQDRKITVEDFQLILEKLGLGFLSKYVARALFFLLDTNHNGVLEFQDLVVLVSIVVKLIRAL